MRKFFRRMQDWWTARAEVRCAHWRARYWEQTDFVSVLLLENFALHDAAARCEAARCRVASLVTTMSGSPVLLGYEDAVRVLEEKARLATSIRRFEKRFPAPVNNIDETALAKAMAGN